MTDDNKRRLIARILKLGEFKHQENRLLLLRFIMETKSRYYLPGDLLTYAEQVVDILIRKPLSLGSTTHLYRARVGGECDDHGYVKKAYACKDMGAPKDYMCMHGRASAAGIPVLYLSTSADLSVAELRPQLDEKISVVKGGLKHAVRLADLRMMTLEMLKMRDTAFGFIPASYTDDELKAMSELSLLFSLRVEEDRKDSEYAYTQLIAEIIKKKGMDGIAYSSLLTEVSSDYNVVLFDPGICTLHDDVRLRKVTRIVVDSEEVKNK